MQWEGKSIDDEERLNIYSEATSKFWEIPSIYRLETFHFKATTNCIIAMSQTQRLDCGTNYWLLDSKVSWGKKC